MSRRNTQSRDQKRRKKKVAARKPGVSRARQVKPVSKGQKFAEIDRLYSLEPLLGAPTELLPGEEAVVAFIDSYRVRLPIDHPFRNELEDARLAPDTLVELAKDHLLFDFVWKLEKLHQHAQREKKQHERLEQAKQLSRVHEKPAKKPGITEPQL